MAADEVAKRTELNGLPSDRGTHACPREGERFKIDAAGELAMGGPHGVRGGYS